MLGVAIPTQIQRAGAVLNRTINYANYAWDFVAPMLPRLRGDADSGIDKHGGHHGYLPVCDQIIQNNRRPPVTVPLDEPLAVAKHHQRDRRGAA